MKSQFLFMVTSSIMLAGVQSVAGESPWDSGPVSPAEAEIQAILEKIHPLPAGIGSGVNDDGNPTLSVSMEQRTDLSPLRGMPVRHMQIFGSMEDLISGESVDLSPLAGMPLETLWIWKAPLKDLSPLSTTRLKKLLIMGAGITDISPLKGLPLTHLDIWCTNVSDISPLKGMHLKRLNIDCDESARVEDLTPLEGMALESLEFHENGVTKGMEIVRGMRSLTKINKTEPETFWKQYDAAAPLRELVAKAGLKFTRLYGSTNSIGLWFHGDDIVDLAPLRGMPVTSLGLLGSKVSDIGPLAGLPLHHLTLNSSELTGISPLRGSSIKSLGLSCAKLTDISPLQETKLGLLVLRCPKVTDLSSIRNLPITYLNFKTSGVTDLSFLEGMSVEDIHFDLAKITKGWEALRGMKSLKQINYQSVEDFWKERDGKKSEDPFLK